MKYAKYALKKEIKFLLKQDVITKYANFALNN